MVETGSFSNAARDTSSVSSVTRQVKFLEDSVGIRLLNRSTRSLSLTTEGSRYYERVKAVLHDLDVAKLELISQQEEVKGILRVTLRIVAGSTVVMPALGRFLKQYPHLQMDIRMIDERQDLVANKIDVAMWMGGIPDADIVARKLSPSCRIVCVSPIYLERYGTPRTPEDLVHHNCLLEAPSFRGKWSFEQDGTIQQIDVGGSVRSDNGVILLSAAKVGIGIFIAHQWMVRGHLQRGELVTILDDYKLHPHFGDSELYAVYPTRHGLPLKTRVFLDFLASLF